MPNLRYLFAASTLLFCSVVSAQNPASAPLPKTPFTDYRGETPGTMRKITAADLPKPFATKSATNGPNVIDRPKDAWPKAPTGFKVELYTTDVSDPRKILAAPNGDIFVVESHGGDIKVFRGRTADGKAQQSSTFISDLKSPYGIAFYPPGPNPQYLYIGNTDAVIRVPYHNGDLKATAKPQQLAKVPEGGGHWTRDLVVASDGKQLFVAVGSESNVDDPDQNTAEKKRAQIYVMNPDGSNVRMYAYGIRNAGGGLAINPKDGTLWCSVNERDELGNNLVPDYITHVEPGGFYGWPYYYIGGNPDPRLKGAHPELKSKVIVPDVLLQAHNASMELAFYEGKQFPAEYQGDIFSSQHGSWNRAPRGGYEVVRIPLHQTGKASGEYEDFLTGFVTAKGEVWGRPVGVTVAQDGSLLVSDDASNSIWRVSYTGK